MFGQDRGALRAVFFNAWAKHQTRQPLEPLEKQIVALLLEHPEYRDAIKDQSKHGERDYSVEAGETNPFLHLSLHLAIRDQMAMDRPAGIRKVMDALRLATGETHDAEHLAMEQLGQALWESQRDGTPPDEHQYLTMLQELALRMGQSL